MAGYHFPSISIALFLCLAFVVDARAETDLAIGLTQRGGQGGVATPQEVEAAVGTASLDLACPEQREHIGLGSGPYDERGVRIHLQNAGVAYRQLPILTALLNRAIQTAQSQCQMTMDGPNGPYDRGDVAYADVYARPREGAAETLVAHAREYYPLYGYWDRVIDVYADQERAEADERARQDRAAGEAAQHQAQAQAQAERQAQLQQQRAADEAASRRSSESTWGWIRLIGIGLFLFWLWTKREIILGWYYALKPHPADDMVHQRVSGGGELDGQLFAEIMRPVPGGRIEQRVRAEQARRLAAMARAAAESRLAELERMKAKVVQEAAFLRAQEDLRSAVETHEMTMARLDAVKAWRKRNVEG